MTVDRQIAATQASCEWASDRPQGAGLRPIASGGHARTTSTTIRRIEVFTLEAPITIATGPSGATYRSRSSVIVRIADGDGVAGWGETYRRPGTAATLSEAAPLLVGYDARASRCLTDLLAAGVADRLAVSALSIAIDDLRARQFGVPVSALYGGAQRRAVRAYASSGGYRDGVDPEVSWLEEVQAARSAGYQACKIRVGRFAPARELPILGRVRSEVGNDVDLMVDANGAYSVPRAIAVGRELERLAFRWFEEPLIRFRRGLAYPGYELLAGLDIPIAAGEGLETRGAFDGFLARSGAAIVQPDVGICGGIGEALFVAELAALRGRQCVPHAWGGAILLAATLQLISLLPEPSELPGIDSPLLEMDRLENPMRTELCEEQIEPHHGLVAIPDKPGLGITVNEDYIRRQALSTHVTSDR
ncbi:MAG: mandelate racemase/muconate lactonizing enzyme family protein [Chloroflexota bacterium]